MEAVTSQDIQRAVHALGLEGQPLCVHSSLRSFGYVEGGASAVVDGLFGAGCTVLVPTMSFGFAVRPLPHQRPARNGTDYAWLDLHAPETGPLFTPDCNDVDLRDMGAIPAAVLQQPDRVRGHHALCSFTAVGPLAQELVAGQAPLDMYAPFRELIARGGSVLLMGVGPTRMTLLHYAEKTAGRAQFVRWARSANGQTEMVECGGCSSGFDQLRPALEPITRRRQVGQSEWLVMPVGEVVTRVVEAIRADPTITHCGDPECGRCRDAVAGGPVAEGEVFR